MGLVEVPVALLVWITGKERLVPISSNTDQAITSWVAPKANVSLPVDGEAAQPHEQLIRRSPLISVAALCHVRPQPVTVGSAGLPPRMSEPTKHMTRRPAVGVIEAVTSV